MDASFYVLLEIHCVFDEKAATNYLFILESPRIEVVHYFVRPAPISMFNNLAFVLKKTSSRLTSIVTVASEFRCVVAY